MSMDEASIIKVQRNLDGNNKSYVGFSFNVAHTDAKNTHFKSVHKKWHPIYLLDGRAS